MHVLLTDEALIKAWKSQLGGAERFQIAMALVSPSGLEHIGNLLEQRLARGAQGQILIGTDLPTHPDALAALKEMQEKHADRLELRRFQPVRTGVFHPKLAIFIGRENRRTAILGSSNLTQGGFVDNVEINVIVKKASETDLLDRFFRTQWFSGRSRPITDEWLAAYRKCWAKRNKALLALQQSRKAVAQIKVPRKSGKALPIRINGSTLVFTGGFGKGWTRPEVLRLVRRLGGIPLDTPASVKRADCLVEGKINPCLETTRKLEIADKHDTPIMPAEDFRDLIAREDRRTERRG